jgi:starch synthase (maltosyl-transferring)
LSTQLAKFGVMSPYLLFVGRYATQKQIPWLIELVRQPYFDQSDLRLVTIGSGPMLPMITAATQQYPSKIVDLGWQADINLFMSGCEMLLLPSAYEGMPNVVLEAMASGKAVAATDVEGVIELLGSNGAAQTSAAGNMSAWIDRVRLLCDDVDLRKRLGAENRVRCQSEFDLAPKMEAYERLLMSVVH